MQNSNAKSLIQSAQMALEGGDVSLFNMAMIDFAEYRFEDSSPNPFEPEVFSFLLDIFSNHEYQKSPLLSKLALIFETEWGRLNDSQKSHLLSLIELQFENTQDELTLFIFAELLGRFFANERSFAVLDKLRRLADNEHRGYVVTGFLAFAKKTSDRTLMGKVVDRLKEMSSDQADIVKNGASDALKILKP
jgi:hypothetical protein